MRRTLGICEIVAVLTCLSPALAPDVATAGHNSKNCGVISHGSADYRIRALKLECKIARTGSIKYLRTEEPRSGFDCAPTEGGSFYCQNPPKAYWGVRL